MVNRLLDYEFNPEEFADSGMTPDRYNKALEASKYIARVISTGAHRKKYPELASYGFDKFFINEAVIKVRRKSEMLNSLGHKPGPRPNEGIRGLDMDSFDELYHHRKDGEPIRQNLVDRGYPEIDIATISWKDASSLHSWHVLLDTHQTYAPHFVEQDNNMIEYISERAGLQPVSS